MTHAVSRARAHTHTHTHTHTPTPVPPCSRLSHTYTHTNLREAFLTPPSLLPGLAASGRDRERLFIGTQFSSLYTSVDSKAELRSWGFSAPRLLHTCSSWHSFSLRLLPFFFSPFKTQSPAAPIKGSSFVFRKGPSARATDRERDIEALAI
jgi:hypothetical protein